MPRHCAPLSQGLKRASRPLPSIGSHPVNCAPHPSCPPITSQPHGDVLRKPRASPWEPRPYTSQSPEGANQYPRDDPLPPSLTRPFRAPFPWMDAAFLGAVPRAVFARPLGAHLSSDRFVPGPMKQNPFIVPTLCPRTDGSHPVHPVHPVSPNPSHLPTTPGTPPAQLRTPTPTPPPVARPRMPDAPTTSRTGTILPPDRPDTG